MNEIKTDLFPESLRAARNGQGRPQKEVKPQSQTETMKAGQGYSDTMTPEEPLPESERPGKDGPGAE